MDGVDLGEKMRARASKLICSQVYQVPILPELIEQPMHLGTDMFRVAEHAAALADAHGPETARPDIDVLKEMTMNRLVMTNAEAASRIRLLGPLQHGLVLEYLERGLIADIGAVLEDGRAGIAVWVGCAVVHAPSPFAGMLLEDDLSALRRA